MDDRLLSRVASSERFVGLRVSGEWLLLRRSRTSLEVRELSRPASTAYVVVLAAP